MGNRLRRIRQALWFVVALSAGCGGMPVQEMSDARQAIEAAQDANAEQYAPELLNTAQQQMELAERALLQGDYEAAREAAADARSQAIEARMKAIASSDLPEAQELIWK